jgi:hypothetical protein
MKHVYTDPRIPWSTTMNYCNLNNMSYDTTVSMLHYACMTSPEHFQVITMNKVTTRPQQSSHTSQRQPSQSSQRDHSSRPIQQATQSSAKQYCRNYQVNNCRRNDCRYLHEADPNFVNTKQPQPVTRDDRSNDARTDKSYSRNRNNKSRNNNRSNQNNNNNNKSGPSNAHLNRMEAQQSDFQSWSSLESSGFRNGSFNVLSIKRKRMHNELVREEEHQKELAWQRENVSLRSHRRADRERRSQSRTPSITSKVSSRDSIDIHSIDEAQPAVELPAEDNRDPVPAVELPAEDNRQFVSVNDTSCSRVEIRCRRIV